MHARSRLALLALMSLAPPAAAAQLNAVEDAVLQPAPTIPPYYGSALAIDGDRLVVGAPHEDVNGLSEAGTAYVYAYDGSTWSEVQRLEAPTPEADAWFGHFVTIAGDFLAVSQRSSAVEEAVYVYRNVGGTWDLQQTLPSTPGSTEFGDYLSMSGDTLAVGAPRQHLPGDGEGGVFVYRLQAGTFVQEALLQEAGGSGDQFFGRTVEIEGDRLVVGATSYGPAGTVFVYQRTGTTWARTAKLEIATFEYLGFGEGLVLDGDRIAIGAGFADTAQGVNSGAAYVYEFDGASWQGSPAIPPPVPTTFFGGNLALIGDVLVANEFDTGTSDLFAFGLQGGSWNHFETFTGSQAPGNGGFVALDSSGDRLAAGTLGPAGGAAYLFRFEPTPQATYCTAGTSASGCTALIGAAGQASSSGTGSFDLSVSGVEGSKRGLFYWGANGRQANPWGTSTSYQCVVPPVFRSALFPESGTTGLCDGAQVLDLHARWALKPEQNPGAGAVVQAQYWYRDPFAATTVQTSISNALEFTVSP